MTSKERQELPYRVGGLLYTPALRAGIADKLGGGACPDLTSLAFCLEDTVRDEALERAEEELREELARLARLPEEKLPLLFVRVRTPDHLTHVHGLLGEWERVLSGYILPKFDLTNAEEYVRHMEMFNRGRACPLFLMPILESRMIADLSTRNETLSRLKAVLDGASELVLNVRVGGNDFCNLYGLRRRADQSIYELGVVRDVLADILNVFAADYVVSGPVWEYFGSDPGGAWARGLRRELELDRLNGFVGKTAIHPSQLPLIRESLQVRREDYEDALRLVNWREESWAVAKSASGDRMNEVKCHTRWARRILLLAGIYGLREEGA